jgi:Tfp pilus assembly protein PilN
MIDINLIPPVLRKNSGNGLSGLSINIPQEILWGVLGGVVCLALMVHLVLGALWLTSEGHLSFDKLQWQKVVSDKSELDGIYNKSRELKNKIKALSDITVNKIVVWSPKLNAISDALPRGLWLRKMLLDKTSMTIEGSAVSKNHDEISNVGNFVSALKKNAAFMKDFSSLEVNSIQRGNRNSIEVADFTIMAKLK